MQITTNKKRYARTCSDVVKHIALQQKRPRDAGQHVCGAHDPRQQGHHLRSVLAEVEGGGAQRRRVQVDLCTQAHDVQPHAFIGLGSEAGKVAVDIAWWGELMGYALGNSASGGVLLFDVMWCTVSV